ncbi:MAG: S8 family serine peptidase [Proteobacteria bacterium]|nr:S8 family serine peptidase [Pseudomonadota bacterium]
MRRALALLVIALATAAVAAEHDPAARIKAAATAACRGPAPDIDSIAESLPAVIAVEEGPLIVRGRRIGWRGTLRLADGGRIEIERIAPGGRLRRLGVTYYAADVPGLRSAARPSQPKRRLRRSRQADLRTAKAGAGQARPMMTALLGPDCVIGLGRRLIYGPGGRVRALEQLDRDLAPIGTPEPLDPPVPAAGETAKEARGVPVAMVDAGVNYLLPEIARRLARDRAGRPLGYDFWDLDDRPFDSNPARSPFFPQRHGTRTASVLLREAPEARLVPYRYPRPDMSRMAKIVDHAAANGVIIVCITLGSNDIADWRAFAAAARARPEMLFVVSAGNNGRDIDARPVYPAALEAGNIIAVTSADASGRLGRGSNWGRRSVDLLVPGEETPVTDFYGRAGISSGSSFAAPRIAALAARLLAAHPDWRAPELRAAIFARARKTAATAEIVGQGLITNPSAP